MVKKQTTKKKKASSRKSPMPRKTKGIGELPEVSPKPIISPAPKSGKELKPRLNDRYWWTIIDMSSLFVVIRQKNQLEALTTQDFCMRKQGMEVQSHASFTKAKKHALWTLARHRKNLLNLTTAIRNFKKPLTESDYLK